MPFHLQVSDMNGNVVPVVPGGRSRVVTLDTREEYVAAAIAYDAYRVGEMDTQLEAIRRGLACLVPIRLLCLFTG